MRSNFMSAWFGSLCSHQPKSPRTPYHPVSTHPLADCNQTIAQETIESLKKSNTPEPKACIALVTPLDDLPQETLEIIAKHLPVKDFYRLACCSKTLQTVVTQAQCEPEKRKEAVRPYTQLFELSEANMIHFADGLESIHIHPQQDQELLASLKPAALSQVQHLTLGWSKDHPTIDEGSVNDILGTFNSGILNSKTGLNNITSLTTQDPNDFELTDDFSTFSNCKNLKEVVFGGSTIKLSHAKLSNLGLAPQLERLSLTGGNALTTENIGALKTFPNLKSLTLKRCITIFPGILQDLKHCSKLSELTIYDSSDNETQNDIEHLLQHAPQLTKLSCQRYWISDESAERLFNIAKKRNAGRFNINGQTLHPVEFSIQQLKPD